MSRFLRHYLLALQFFSRVPVTGRLADWVGFSPAMLRASAAHFPGVGWLAGVWMGGVFFALQWCLPPLPASPWVAAVGATIAGVLFTGAFHEDGLADLFDGLGGSADRARALEIMKDSRIGSFGAIALVLALLAKVSLLVLLAQSDALRAVVAVFAAQVVSRAMPLLVIYTLPHVGDAAGSKSKPLADSLSPGALLAAGLWTALAMCLVVWLYPTTPWWSATLGALLGTAWMRGWLQRRLQGFTGDGLGATQQVSELLFYLALALSL
ncbi:MAG: adenosylcobinamide-GDP ribazoletransferase [Hydrogenophaga sp.]|uniref:adenosylcobinamide-GDP ribazoletransferase n=1 Tax=Hydrogenophaga sp. TaxID=1904254 RepID=UPI001D498ECB|nr:adenosylcobinamide-GDP ribazoletransferase [Hydrogenophaga sp.]MBX3609787.1 adenosylcobinamide-GDP ribazoletransferase [Hydrogenophaga sp.]